MTAKATKLDKFIKAVDKLEESKGVSMLTNTLDKTLNIAGDAVSAVADITNHQLDEHNKRHLNDVKVPDIRGLSLEQTRKLFATLDIKYALVVPEPDASFAKAKVDIIVSTVPKANTVLSAGSFVKIYYLNAEVIEESKMIASTKENRKQIRKEAAKTLTAKLGHSTALGASNILKATTNVTKKMTRHSKKVTNPKKINATIIDVPFDPDNDIDDESK